MKEQWKKFDGDAKLLVNVEEGRPVIELPVSNKATCCERLSTVLKILAFTASIIMVTWVATIVYAYYYHQSALKLDGDAFDVSHDYKSGFGNELYLLGKEGKQVPNAHHESGEESLSTEEPNPNNRTLEDWKEAVDKMMKVKELLQGVTAEGTPGGSAEGKTPRENDFFDKAVYGIVRSAIPLVEDIEENDDDDKGSVKTPEATDEAPGDSRKMGKTEDSKEVANVLLQLVNLIAPYEVPSSEEYTSLKELDSRNSTTGAVQKASDAKTLMSKYLEPIVGEDGELLAWYYLGGITDAERKDPRNLKLHTAKLLYSSNIAEFLEDMKSVLESLLLDTEFVRDFKLLLEGRLKLASPVDPTSMRFRIVDRIATKFNMNKLVEEDPKIVGVFSRMIEANNRLELGRMYIKVGEALFENIGQSSQEFFEESPEEAERRRLEVLAAIKKVGDDDKGSAEDGTVGEDSMPVTESISELVAQESEEEDQSVEEPSSTVASLKEDEVVEDAGEGVSAEDTNMNEYLQVYGDFYD
ncbi:uncharacterized protein LOC106647786 [Copidosoma floridanum]|uniref:uncharacterized protein LOC106647786 n=1 Tax=Copidosoma floridanum TaxID=29053 RepID=UPI0006C9447A|nr:uncharacterized protein LOC106647786 [Copidosoma floridanum]